MPDLETLRSMSVGIYYEKSTNRMYLHLICDHEDDGISRGDFYVPVQAELARYISEKSFVEIEIIDRLV